MVFKSEFYGGSRLLDPVADYFGLQIDQVNFMVCQLTGLVLAIPFRTKCTAEKVGVQARHIIEIVVGVLLTLFCFGYQIWHLLMQSMVSYVVMAWGGPKFSHWGVLVWSMIYLSACHLYRQAYDYGGYTLDITGPLMIQTQKITSLAFALHDGRYKEEASLSADQKNQAVKELPSVTEYLSFMFYFHGIMVGPTTFYKDYLAFIDGSNFLVPAPANSSGHPTDNLNKVVIKKLLTASACCVGMMILPGMFFPPEKLDTPEFYNYSFIWKMIFILGCLTIAKQKYYFAWMLSDALNNLAGFGFSGYNDNGEAKWDLTENVNIAGVELSTSLKTNIDSWNTKTIVWLRRVVYDRLDRPYNTPAVFFVSALWHGFYAGYYFTFLGGSFFIQTSRMVRRQIRPFFLTSPALKIFYDALTFTATRFSNAYLCFTFLTLNMSKSLRMYQSLYYCLHIAVVAIFLVLKFAPIRSGHHHRQSMADSSVLSDQNDNANGKDKKLEVNTSGEDVKKEQ